MISNAEPIEIAVPESLVADLSQRLRSAGFSFRQLTTTDSNLAEVNQLLPWSESPECLEDLLLAFDIWFVSLHGSSNVVQMWLVRDLKGRLERLLRADETVVLVSQECRHQADSMSPETSVHAAILTFLYRHGGRRISRV